MFPWGKKLFDLRVQGDSMISDHIASGDLLIIEKKRGPKTERNPPQTREMHGVVAGVLRRFKRTREVALSRTLPH
jgi:hypothetical protein